MVAVGQYGNAPTSCILLWHHSWSGVSRGLALHSCAGRMDGFVDRSLVSNFCSVAVSSLVLVGADHLRTPCSHLVWFGELRWR